ncbi:hypothetical protein E1B28_002373 [Marasmius oreades]|uniref:Cerato-platanin n=1 Tax=Marasmius oreades TaxID=181124 RepID=A0A9P7UNW2_9AGAR|nr:uncharacterized protein E1B28_002373 [Marasmius oreades]KAG7086419.1 hypothetical protein E1B28_002373 [Marasmius oreades]
MKFISLLNSLALATATLAVDVAWDSAYDNPNGALTTVACSTGANGLITRFNFQKFSDIPSFPFIGGAPNILGFDSPACGACWEISYTNETGITKTVHFTGIDVGGTNFVTGQGALNQLTNGRAVELGIAPVTATAVGASACGLPA